MELGRKLVVISGSYKDGQRRHWSMDGRGLTASGNSVGKEPLIASKS